MSKPKNFPNLTEEQGGKVAADMAAFKEELEKIPTIEDLKRLLQADRQAREQRAMARINQVLTEERCTMNPVMVLTNGTVAGRIEIKSVD